MNCDPHGQWFHELEDALFRTGADLEEPGISPSQNDVNAARRALCRTRAKTADGAYWQVRHVLDFCEHNTIDADARRALQLAALTIADCAAGKPAS